MSDRIYLAEFGCFTGDCPHDTASECREAIADDWLRQRAEIERLTAERSTAKKTVAFFTSVIKSGEAWSDQCEEALKAVMETPDD